MSSDTAFALKYLGEVEEMAEEILADKEQVVNLDCRRNKNREALSALKKEMKNNSTEKKCWICFGNMFVKLPKPKVKEILEKEQTHLKEEIGNLSNNLKQKVAKLNDMEGKPPLIGFNLQPLSNEEKYAIKSAFKL
ncbi:p53 and DNA damage-regulated protein 1 [Centruroides vittatus]|uniref:p53 and DNA damage-regulated protein 1 n=1 Tax=Centruroides vittatus TaxID=120091 RepID=UPI000C6ED3C6|nr:p53 and DNA damage-regulated protein 1-like isoform X2 [Centruroides sculpturatus]XP_023218639.1 p53 and DNA damage-regulated protein 1-like isoform X2 [Centruroides sculpturatus]XP_023218640.1 p53 and DNA damage-regulated protein 1-like isoform X2 [Centruroides sculpturatus]